MVARRMPRVQEIILPVLREELPGVQVTSWIPAVEDRQYPLVNIRRLGGLPSNGAYDIEQLDRPVIEMTAYTRDGLVPTEDLYLDAQTVLSDMCKYQRVTEKGYIHSFFITMGMTQFNSNLDGTWRVQGLIQLGIRPRKNS